MSSIDHEDWTRASAVVENLERLRSDTLITAEGAAKSAVSLAVRLAESPRTDNRNAPIWLWQLFPPLVVPCDLNQHIRLSALSVAKHGQSNFDIETAKSEATLFDCSVLEPEDVAFYPVDSRNWELVETRQRLSDVVDSLRDKCRLLGVDIEHWRPWKLTADGIISTIQISGRGYDYVIDAISIGVKATAFELCRLFRDRRILKVFFAMNNDIVWLRECFDLNLPAVSVCDLQSFGNILLARGYGLNSLWEDMGLLVMPKAIKMRHQRANWGIRPLPRDLVAYSRLDSHFLPFMAGVILALVTATHPLILGASLCPLHQSVVRCMEHGNPAEEGCGCLELLSIAVEKMGSSWRGLLTRHNVSRVLFEEFLQPSCGNRSRSGPTTTVSGPDCNWFRTIEASRRRRIFAHRVLANSLEFYLPFASALRRMTLLPMSALRATGGVVCELPYGGERWLNGHLALLAELWSHNRRKRKPAQVLKQVFSSFCCAARALGANWITSTRDQDFHDGVFCVWCVLLSLRNVFAMSSGAEPSYVIPDELLLWLCLVLPTSLKQFDTALCTFVAPRAESSATYKQDLARLLLQVWERLLGDYPDSDEYNSEDEDNEDISCQNGPRRLSYRDRLAILVYSRDVEPIDSQLPHLTHLQAQMFVEACRNLLSGSPYPNPKAKRLLITIEQFRINSGIATRLPRLTMAASMTSDDDLNEGADYDNARCDYDCDDQDLDGTDEYY